MRTELPYRRQKTPRMRRKAAFGVFCLTTVYPTTATGAHGNSGGKTAGKDVFPSGKGRKRLKMSGNRYSQILWEQDAAGSSPVTSTKKRTNRVVSSFSFHIKFYSETPCIFIKALRSPWLLLYCRSVIAPFLRKVSRSRFWFRKSSTL